jgi:hypothetical protein
MRAFFVKDNAEFLRGGLIFSLGTKPDGGVAGELGWSSGTYMIKDRAGRVVDTGWYFSVSRKVAGRWLYVRDALEFRRTANTDTTGTRQTVIWHSYGLLAPAPPLA